MDAIDDKNLHRGLLQFQLEPKLLLQQGKKLKVRPQPASEISNEKRACRLEGFCDDVKLPEREVPLKSHFDQVRRASGFDGLNLLKSPVSREL